MITNNSEREKKFNDFGIDDYAPLEDVLPKWIAGDAMPDRAVVDATLTTVERAARPYALRSARRSRDRVCGRDACEPVDDDKFDDRCDRALHARALGSGLLPVDGFRLAPTAPHDNHFANWGTGHSSRTGVIATALTEAALLDAIDERAVFASEDEELQLRVYADGRVPMGGKLVTRGATAKLDIWLSDANYTGGFEVVVYSGAIGGADVRK